MKCIKKGTENWLRPDLCREIVTEATKTGRYEYDQIGVTSWKFANGKDKKDGYLARVWITKGIHPDDETAITCNSQNRQRSSKEIEACALPDSYEKFIDTFHVSSGQFCNFGISMCHFADYDQAWQQWRLTKEKFLSKEGQFYIRGYGKNRSADLFAEMYRILFNINVICDKNGNYSSNKQLYESLGLGTAPRSYCCSHIFPYTNNFFLFDALYNIVYCPKIFDPLTEKVATPTALHKQFFAVFRRECKNKFEPIFNDYNSFVRKNRIIERIYDFLTHMPDNYSGNNTRFRNEVKKQWQDAIF